MQTQTRTHSRNGKIASLPQAIRNEVNRRLDDAELSSDILAWLNAEPGVRAVLDQRWRGQPIQPGSLNEWRRGGYQDHLRQQERLAQVRELASFAAQLGEAEAEKLTGGCLALVMAKLFELLQVVEMNDADDVPKLVKLISVLRSVDLSKTKIELERTKIDQNQTKIDLRQKSLELSEKTLAQRDRALDLEQKRFEHETSQPPRARKRNWNQPPPDLGEDDGDNSAKIEERGKLMFAEVW